MEVFLITVGTLIGISVCFTISSWAVFKKLERDEKKNYSQRRKKFLLDVGVTAWIKKNSNVPIRFWSFREDPVEQDYVYVTPLSEASGDEAARNARVIILRSRDFRMVNPFSGGSKDCALYQAARVWLSKVYETPPLQQKRQLDEALELYNIFYLKRFISLGSRDESPSSRGFNEIGASSRH